VSRHRGRAYWTALILGAAFALALQLWRPGAWRIGSTPRFLATVVLAIGAGLWLWIRRDFGPPSNQPPRQREGPAD
jgi:hypothetical protein